MNQQQNSQQDYQAQQQQQQQQAQQQQMQQQQTYQQPVAEQTQAPTQSDPAALTELQMKNGWERYDTEDGKPYYYHRPTGVTQWEKPI